MKKILLSATALVLAGATAAPAIAAPIMAPVPTANYITFAGKDWAWAAPCAPVSPSCGVVDMSYQSTQGWRIATAADFASGITAAAFGTVNNFKCAAAWFSTAHTHCDYNDAATYFAVYNDPRSQFPGNGAVETWVVRGGAVPEPATWAMMLAGFGAIGFAMRRKTEQKVRVRFAI